MLTRLQLETRSLHPAADAPWVALMTFDATRERYIATLVATYGFEAPIEAALAMTPDVSRMIDLRQRARSGFIVQDLLALGLTPSQIARLPQCSHIMPFRDVSEALGWVYVVERSTLLHETVRHHLRSYLPGLDAYSYLDAYDGVAELRWEDLGQALDLVSLRHDSGDQIVAGARAAFVVLHEWQEGEEAKLIARA
jgi:heme oxygenase